MDVEELSGGTNGIQHAERIKRLLSGSGVPSSPRVYVLAKLSLPLLEIV